MRLQNVWFDLLSFVVAILMVWYSVYAIIDYVKDPNASLFQAITSAGSFLMFAGLFFWISLRLGDSMRKARESKRVGGEK